MKLFKTESGVIYHTYMYNGTRVVFFNDYRDAESLGLNVVDTDDMGHGMVRYDEVKNLPFEKWMGEVWWPQCLGEEGDDCDIILAIVSMEDASTDDKCEQFCSKRFYEFEQKWDNGEYI